MEQKLDRVPHRRVFHDRDLRAGDHAHIEKMLTERAFPVQLRHNDNLSDFRVFQRLHTVSPLLDRFHLNHRFVHAVAVGVGALVGFDNQLQ